MRLLAITINENKYPTKKTSFRGVEHFEHIKNLPNMVCGCCGRPTLPVKTLIDAITPVTRSLKKNLQLGALDYVKKYYPAAWENLLALSQSFPEDPLDKIIEDSSKYIELKKSITNTIETRTKNPDKYSKAVTDRYIGRVFFNMLASARSYMMSSPFVISAISPLKPFLFDTQKQTINLFTEYSKQYPDKTLSEIVQKEEVFSLHSKKDMAQKKELTDKLNYHFNNIKNNILNLKPELDEDIDNIKKNVINIFKTEKDPKARIHKAKKLYEKFLTENNCEIIKNKVLQEVEQIPVVFVSADTFFAYAHKNKLSDGEIIKAIFDPVLATEEHLDLVADGGLDETTNKINLHKICNHFRNNIPYPEFLEYHPDMPQHTQTQLNLVSEALLNDKLPSFLEFYPVKMPQVLSEISDGKIQLDVTKYCEQGLKKSQEKAEKILEQLNEVIKIRDQKLATKWQNYKFNKTLEKEIKALNSKILDLKEEYKIQKKLQKRMRLFLYQ